MISKRMDYCEGLVKLNWRLIMNKQSSSVTSMFDQLPLTASQRVRAEAQMRQSEFLAELMLSAFRAIKTVAGALLGQAKAKPAQRLGTAS